MFVHPGLWSVRFPLSRHDAELFGRWKRPLQRLLSVFREGILNDETRVWVGEKLARFEPGKDTWHIRCGFSDDDLLQDPIVAQTSVSTDRWHLYFPRLRAGDAVSAPGGESQNTHDPLFALALSAPAYRDWHGIGDRARQNRLPFDRTCTLGNSRPLSPPA